MNAWFALTVVLCTAFVVVGILIDKHADRGAAFRWEERFYQPQLPARRGRVVDARSRPVQSIDP